MIARHIFDSEHDVFRDTVRRFLMEEAYEQHVQWEKDGQIDRDFWYKAGTSLILRRVKLEVCNSHTQSVQVKSESVHSHT